MDQRTPLFVFALLLSTSCGGAGRYGYARSYVYYGNEAPYGRRAHDALYDEVRRLPDRFNQQLISWFGVVTSVTTSGAESRLGMQLRIHQERHLCEDESESSCRVTVSESDGGPFTAVLRLAPEDQIGENRLQPGALVRVYGTLSQGEYDPQGGPVLRAEFYRHWPRGQYVTTAARGAFRR